MDTNGDAPPRKRQCELLGLARSSTYYKRQAPKDDSATEKAILELYEQDATLGYRRLPVMLQSRYGIKIRAKKCQRLKKKLGLRSLYPHRDTSKPNPRAEKEPYLLKDMEEAVCILEKKINMKILIIYYREQVMGIVILSVLVR